MYTSKQILDILIVEFPGLLDHDYEVEGADLVDLLSNLLEHRKMNQ